MNASVDRKTVHTQIVLISNQIEILEQYTHTRNTNYKGFWVKVKRINEFMRCLESMDNKSYHIFDSRINELRRIIKEKTLNKGNAHERLSKERSIQIISFLSDALNAHQQLGESYVAMRLLEKANILIKNRQVDDPDLPYCLGNNCQGKKGRLTKSERNACRGIHHLILTSIGF